MTSIQRSYLLIGAGVFGVSTAYQLIRKYPGASITLVDRDAFDAESRVAASWDWNKVVRADYDDIVYCALALEAQDIFKADPLWQPYFHEVGQYRMCRDEFATSVVANYRKLGRRAEPEIVPVERARKMFDGLFDNADFEGVKEVLVNKTSGWAAAGDCLLAVTREVIRLGVKYIAAEVDSLEFSRGERCSGVKLRSGSSLAASHVILCTGAFTPSLLETSAARSGIQDLAAGDRIVAGGITTGMTRLDEATHKRFADMPVCVQGYTTKQGPFIGSLPPTSNKELKWWGRTIFTNTREVLPGRRISVPPAQRDYAQWKIPKVLKADIDHARHVFYGEDTAHWRMDKHRICWDAFTTSGDFIISPHPASQGLYVATCGNFHGWKFFPVLGKYIVQMLEGALAPELVEKWAWDREWPDPSLNSDYPRHEMNSLLDPIGVPRL